MKFTKGLFLITFLIILIVLSGCSSSNRGSKNSDQPLPTPQPNYLYIEVEGTNYGLGDYPIGGTTIPVKVKMYNLSPGIIISKIDIYCENELVGSNEAGVAISNGYEYSFTWDTRNISTDGNHTLKAVATTNLGLFEASKVLNISHIFYTIALAYDPAKGCHVRAKVYEVVDSGVNIMSEGEVKVNGDQLTYDSSTKKYSATFSSIKPSDQVSFTISKDGRNISKTYQIPTQTKIVDLHPDDIQRWLNGEEQELTISLEKYSNYYDIYILFYKSDGTTNYYYRGSPIQINDTVSLKVPRSEIREGTVYADVVVATYFQGPTGVYFDRGKEICHYHLFSFSEMVSTREGGEPQDIISFWF